MRNSMANRPRLGGECIGSERLPKKAVVVVVDVILYVTRVWCAIITTIIFLDVLLQQFVRAAMPHAAISMKYRCWSRRYSMLIIVMFIVQRFLLIHALAKFL